MRAHSKTDKQAVRNPLLALRAILVGIVQVRVGVPCATYQSAHLDGNPDESRGPGQASLLRFCGLYKFAVDRGDQDVLLEFVVNDDLRRATVHVGPEYDKPSCNNAVLDNSERK